MNQACEDILGKQVKIPVEANVYGAQVGYPDPGRDRIDAMLKTVLKGGNEVRNVPASGAPLGRVAVDLRGTHPPGQIIPDVLEYFSPHPVF